MLTGFRGTAAVHDGVRAIACASLILALATGTGAHGDVHDRIVRATRAIAARPGEAALYLARGELYRAHHQVELALGDYASALKLAPALDAARLARGRLLVEAGRPSTALTDLDRFLSSCPRHADAHLLRARAHASLGHVALAESDYDEALNGTPDPERYVERARLVRRAADGGPARALDGLDAGMATIGPVAPLAFEAIEIEIGLGRHEAALARLDQLIAAAGGAVPWLALRADILRAAGRATESRAAYARAIAALDALPPARSHTGQMTTLRHHLTEAVRQLADARGRSR